MKTKNTNIITKNKDITSVFVISASILMIPLIAMQFSNEWDWNLFDFIIIGTFLVSTGLLIILASRKIKNIKYKIVAFVALVTALLLTWAEIAVGVFGTPFAGS